LADDLDPRWAGLLSYPIGAYGQYSTSQYPPYPTLPYPTVPYRTLPHPTASCCVPARDSARLLSSLHHSHYFSDRSNQSISPRRFLCPPLSYLHTATLPTFSSHNQILLIFAPIKDQTSHQSLRSMSLLISTLSYTHYLSPSTATPHLPVTSSHRPNSQPAVTSPQSTPPGITIR
jgi:hypothetical protein